MHKEIREFLGLAGIRLCMQSWNPDNGSGKAILIIMHGGINHCDMQAYDDMACLLVSKGYSVYSFDQRGFGRSEGHRMHMDCWDDFRGDFASFLRLVRTLEPGKPVFAYGISFGACQVIDQAIVSPHLLDGIIAASFSTRPVNIPLAALKVMSVIGRLMPKKKVDGDLQPSFQGAAEKMAGTTLWHDPLCPRHITMGFTYRLFNRQKQLAGELQYLTIPVLHQQGMDDSITLPDSSIAEKIGTEDYTYIEYSETGHELLGGKDPDAVMNDIYLWLEERSGNIGKSGKSEDGSV
ncbi:alpha/beta hydrolase [Ruminococcaceae bacterium OttesenSCG-928-D13]|nr:alpha/beta hydrolase [Ruminococcaceae bacterium OttesenSCG-928-D13]